jgi:enamine deaminase RidA (YjgF/YER057c/UK114 family)
MINPPDLVEPKGSNHGTLAEDGPILSLAGQDPTGPDGSIVGKGDLVAQYRQVLENLVSVVEEGGGTADDIVKLNIYVVDRQRYLENRSRLGAVHQEYLDHYPAMAFFHV